jgi:aerobic carbon-monoxide dehydrogenase medium subunit
MIPNTFEYQRANSVDEALQMLAAGNGMAKILGGGHSLLPSMKLRLSQPETLIDISRIADLRYIRAEGNMLYIGAATTHDDIESSKEIQQHCPMLSETAGLIGDQQVRNRGTIGGAMAHGDPAADYPGALLASNATVVMKSANGTREIPCAEFFLGLFDTALEENELITEIRVPAQPANSTSTYQKFMQPASRYAIVGCAVQVTMQGNVIDDIRVAFTSVSDHAFRDANLENALKGKPATADNIAEAAKLAAQEVDPMSDHFASEEYRRHLARVYAKRAIQAAVDKM